MIKIEIKIVHHCFRKILIFVFIKDTLSNYKNINFSLKTYLENISCVCYVEII